MSTGTPSVLLPTCNSDFNPILEVKNLTAYYGDLKVVSNVSLNLFSGKTLAIVGESGSGKSTLALALIGAHEGRQEGQILYRNRPLLEKPNFRGSKITMVFQDPAAALNPVYTIGWQLLEAIHLHFDIDEETAYQLALNSLKEVQLDQPELTFEKYPHELSGGQKQRAMLAMAMAPRPDILIADEPTTALDVTIQMEIIDLIRKLQKELGMALLLITHDMGVMAELADTVIVMYAGTSVETGTKAEILHKPLHPYTQALLEASFLKKDANGRLLAIKGNVPAPGALPAGCPFHPRCPYAWSTCRQKPVPDFLVNDQTVKCFLYDPTESKRS